MFISTYASASSAWAKAPIKARIAKAKAKGISLFRIGSSTDGGWSHACNRAAPPGKRYVPGSFFWTGCFPYRSPPLLIAVSVENRSPLGSKTDSPSNIAHPALRISAAKPSRSKNELNSVSGMKADAFHDRSLHVQYPLNYTTDQAWWFTA